MAGFKVISAMTEGQLNELPISSLALVIGDLIERIASATTWVKTTATTDFFTRKAIVMQTVTTAATVVLAYELDGTETVEAQVTNTAAATHNGDRMTLTDENTVNNTGTDVTGQATSFIQDRPGSTTTSIIGRVLVGNGVDPDAA